MESRVVGQGWSCGVNKCVAVKGEKMDGGNKTEERRRRSGWGQPPARM